MDNKMDDTSRDSELENYLDALTDFQKKPSKSIPSVLEQLLQRIARHGEPLFPWFKLKPLIVMKLENVIEEYIEYNPHEEVPILPNVENVRFDDMRERLLKALDSFNSAPFTIQRLCELLTEPKRYYRRSDKFMRGIEKNVQVVSTITPSGKRITSFFDLEKNPPMVNGIVPEMDASPSTDNNGFVRPDSDAFSSSSSSSSSSGSTSSRVDSMNGLSRPYCNSEAMDAPLQFAYPLASQHLDTSVTVMPFTNSSLRSELNRINGTHLELHKADAKETSEAVADVALESQDSEKRTSEERTLSEENVDVDATSEVSSSDTESFSGDNQKKEEEEMEVDVASSGDTEATRDGDAGVGEVTEQGQGKESGDVSTSESSGAPVEKSRDGDDAGKADSSEASESTTPMECEEELCTNSEAASSDEQPKEEEPAQEEGETPAGEAEEHSEACVGASGDACPADSSNDAKSVPPDCAEENPVGSSEADSKDSSPAGEEDSNAHESTPPPATQDPVESSADAGVRTQSTSPPHTLSDTPADTPAESVTDPSSSDSTDGGELAQPLGDGAPEDGGGEDEGGHSQPQAVVSESAQS